MHLETPPTGEQLKHQGQALAAAVSGKWVNVALAHLPLFLDQQKDSNNIPLPFTFGDFRQWAINHGMGEPPSVNAWGSLPKAAMRAGLCLPTGQFVKATDPRAHARMLRLWRAV